jgi:hypothetical protein
LSPPTDISGKLSLSGGTMTGTLSIDQPSDYDKTTLTSLTSAPIMVPETNVGSTDTFLPIIHQKALYASGYRTHLNIGLRKDASGWGTGTGFNSSTGMYVALGGSDNNPTKAFNLTYDGNIFHSDGHKFWNSDNMSANTVSSGPPAVGEAGALFYNTASNVLNVSDGSAWKPVYEAPKMVGTGGTITTHGAYQVNTFTSSGTFSTDVTGIADVLIVAGGGGGGGGAENGGGAGGAGGLIYLTSVSITAGSHSISIGGGGSNGSGTGSNGGNSVAFNNTAIGGGYGSSGSRSENGGNGGSGGSASRDSLNNGQPGSGTSGQGNNAGLAGAATCAGSGGGGGAGQAGYQGDSYDCNSTRSPATASQGGYGQTYNIRNGDVVYYAGGGGGAGHYSDGPALGGEGGGGSGGVSSGTNYAAGHGATNSGGGGGAGHSFGAGNGGSGIVVVRYLA